MVERKHRSTMSQQEKVIRRIEIGMNVSLGMGGPTAQAAGRLQGGKPWEEVSKGLTADQRAKLRRRLRNWGFDIPYVGRSNNVIQVFGGAVEKLPSAKEIRDKEMYKPLRPLAITFGIYEPLRNSQLQKSIPPWCPIPIFRWKNGNERYSYSVENENLLIEFFEETRIKRGQRRKKRYFE